MPITTLMKSISGEVKIFFVGKKDSLDVSQRFPRLYFENSTIDKNQSITIKLKQTLVWEKIKDKYYSLLIENTSVEPVREIRFSTFDWSSWWKWGKYLLSISSNVIFANGYSFESAQRNRLVRKVRNNQKWNIEPVWPNAFLPIHSSYMQEIGKETLDWNTNIMWSMFSFIVREEGSFN